MATEALIHLATFAVTKLMQEANFLLGVPDKVVALQKDLRVMNFFLEEAEKKREEDGRVAHWVSEIREAVYDAEDIIDAFILKESIGKDSLLQRLRDWHNVGVKIESLQCQLNAIPRRLEILGVSTNVAEGISTGSSSDRMMLHIARQSSPRVDEGHVSSTVGLKEKEEHLVKQLTEGDRIMRRRRVISVVGLGGIGKTALAKKVYNHKKVVDHFGRFRAWVYVSRDYQPRDIYRQILDQVYAPTSREEAAEIKEFDENQLGDFLRDKLLEGSKYLVVLDDVWTYKDWDRLAKVSINEPGSLGRVFPDTGNGRSRLLLTTRDENVAKHADARGILLKMQFLSPKDSRDLFRRKAFLDADPESYHPSLHRLGEMMVKKCHGLPLAIVVLGGLLSRNISQTEWRKVLDNMEAYLAERDQPVMVILNLSYITLPSHLKLCFLHLCLFPEDYVISTRKLLSLWIAEGFVQKQGNNNQRLKDTANGYLNQLISRNLVQVVRMSVNKRVMECRVHDFVRQLAIQKAKEENFININSQSSASSSSSTANSHLSSTKFRWQSVHSDYDMQAPFEHSAASCLRSLLFSQLDGGNFGIPNVCFVCERFKKLRVLDLEGLQIANLPNKFGELIFLRYLGLRNTGLKTLPSSVKDLGSLQTLDTNNLKNVPEEVSEVQNLRDLYMDGQKEPKAIQVGKLKNLQNLSGIRFDQWIRNYSSKLLSTCLLKLRLEGRFGINGVDFSNSISELHNLRSLYLKASDGSSIPPLVMTTWPRRLSKLDIKGRMLKLPKTLQFPPNLSQLTLEGTKLDDDPMPILEKLPALSTLRLRSNSYVGDEMRVSLNGFAHLNVLQISELTRLSNLIIERGAMPWLTELQFCRQLHVSNLSELQKLVEVDIIDHISAKIIPFHMLPKNGEWKCTPRTYRNNARGFHLYLEQGQTSPSSGQTSQNSVQTPLSPAQRASSPSQTLPNLVQTPPSPSQTTQIPSQTPPSQSQTPLVLGQTSPIQTPPSSIQTPPSPSQIPPVLGQTSLGQIPPSPSQTAQSLGQTSQSPCQTLPNPNQTSPSQVQTPPIPVQTPTSPSQTAQSLGQTPPNPSQTPLVLGQTSPVQTPPSSIQTPPSPSQTPPILGQTSPVLGQTPPSSSQTPLVLGQTSPVQAPPSSVQTPPSPSQTPLVLGQISPVLGQTPLGPSQTSTSPSKLIKKLKGCIGCCCCFCSG